LVLERGGNGWSADAQNVMGRTWLIHGIEGGTDRWMDCGCGWDWVGLYLEALFSSPESSVSLDLRSFLLFSSSSLVGDSSSLLFLFKSMSFSFSEVCTGVREPVLSSLSLFSLFLGESLGDSLPLDDSLLLGE